MDEQELNQEQEQQSELQRTEEEAGAYDPNQEFKTLVREGTKEGILQAIQPPPALDLPDDEFKQTKKEARTWAVNCIERARESQSPGDRKAWLDRSEFLEKDLKALGPSVREKVLEEADRFNTYSVVSVLGDQSRDASPIWGSKRMQHDSGIMVHKFNESAREDKDGQVCLLFPGQESKGGSLKEIRPSNMRMLQLDKAAADRIIKAVYRGGYPNLPGISRSEQQFRRLHDLINAGGHSGLIRPTFGPAPAQSQAGEKGEAERKSPTDMSQREFEKWRVKNGARKF